MRYLLSRKIPPFTRVLLVESGSRSVYDRLIPFLYENVSPEMQLDLVTCLPDVPKGFRGEVFRVSDYSGRNGRKRLYTELKAREYTLAGLLCSGEPIMTKWKWAIAFQLPAKIFLVNENADFMLLDWGQQRLLRQMALERMGLTGTLGITAMARAVALPFGFLFLLLYAAQVHLRRAIRRKPLASDF